MPNTALITGASAGIGAEFARYHAAKGGDLILTARRADTLNRLKAELETAHNITAHVFAADLAKSGAAQKLWDDITAAGLTPDILINNAGFGGLDRHINRPLNDELEMIDLNVKALVALTQLCAKTMVARRAGHILNVSSTAGMVPGPNQAVYFATKAFVTSYSQALYQELQGTGVGITILAPGYVETEFADRADMHGTELVNGGGATPASVAKYGYDAMMNGDLIAINDGKLRFMMNWIIPFAPRKMVLKMIEKSQTKGA